MKIKQIDVSCRHLQPTIVTPQGQNEIALTIITLSGATIRVTLSPADADHLNKTIQQAILDLTQTPVNSKKNSKYTVTTTSDPAQINATLQ